VTTTTSPVAARQTSRVSQLHASQSAETHQHHVDTAVNAVVSETACRRTPSTDNCEPASYFASPARTTPTPPVSPGKTAITPSPSSATHTKSLPTAKTNGRRPGRPTASRSTPSTTGGSPCNLPHGHQYLPRRHQSRTKQPPVATARQLLTTPRNARAGSSTSAQSSWNPPSQTHLPPHHPAHQNPHPEPLIQPVQPSLRQPETHHQHVTRNPVIVTTGPVLILMQCGGRIKGVAVFFLQLLYRFFIHALIMTAE
jgi:hypothetical protein